MEIPRYWRLIKNGSYGTPDGGLRGFERNNGLEEVSLDGIHWRPKINGNGHATEDPFNGELIFQAQHSVALEEAQNA